MFILGKYSYYFPKSYTEEVKFVLKNKQKIYLTTFRRLIFRHIIHNSYFRSRI